MVPLALEFSDHLDYDSTHFMAKDTDSALAGNTYDVQFPSESTAELIVVVQTDNHTAASHFIQALNATVINDTAIQNLTNTTSLAGMQRSTLVSMTPQLYDGLWSAMDGIYEANYELYNSSDSLRNSSDQMYTLREAALKINDQLKNSKNQLIGLSNSLYSARDQLVAAHDGLYLIKGVPDMIYGIPQSYVAIYSRINGTGADDVTSSVTAYNLIYANVSSDANALGYLTGFNSTWSALGYNAYPDTRAKTAISMMSSFVLAGASSNATEYGMLYAAYNELSYDTYAAGEKTFCINMVIASQNLSASYATQLSAVYDLGAYPPSSAYDSMVISGAASQSGVTADQLQAIKDVYSMGRNPSSSTIVSYLIQKAQASTDNADEKQLIQEAWDLGNPTNETLDAYVLNKVTKGLNESSAAAAREIYSWGENPSNETIYNYILSKAMDGKNASENQTIQDIFNLGRNPSNDSIRTYVVDQIVDSLNSTTGNNSYFYSLIDLGRNMTDDELEAFAGTWADTHDEYNPMIFPKLISGSLSTDNVSLYMVTIEADSIKDADRITATIQELRTDISAQLATGDYPGVNVYVTGSSAISTDTKTSALGDMSRIDIFTVLVVLILLLIYFRSVLSPLVPLSAIGIAIVGSMGALTVISYFINLYYIVETLMIVVMMGAGIDYCVFMLSRYVEERREGRSVHDAVVNMVTHAGKSIISSGMTAALGFGALTLSGQGMFSSMGIGVAVGLVFCMITALTLIPAVLSLIGDRMFWPNKIYNVKPSKTMTGLWEGLTGRVLKHSKVIVVIVVLVAIPAVFFAAHLSTGMDLVSMLPTNAESRQGFSVLEDSIGSSAMGKVMIVVTMPENLTDASGNYTADAMWRIENISAMAGTVDDVDKVYSMSRPDGVTISYDNLTGYSPIEKAYYENYMKSAVGLDNRTTVIYATLQGSPYSNTAFAAIDNLRTLLENNNTTGALAGTVVNIGGEPTSIRDMEAANTKAFSVVIPVVVIGILLILFVLLRSVFLPIRILVTLSLSICLTLAAYVVFFQIGQGETMIFLLPMMMLCALMGMGVDYDIFLVTRVLEEKHNGKTDAEAIKKAISSIGTIILICAFIMGGAFATQLLSSMQMMQQVGFALSAGVLIDATVMLLVVVPAVMLLMGRLNWWWPFGGKKEEAPVAATPEEKKKEP